MTTTQYQLGQVPDIVELLPGRLYLLGGRIALDGRVSWAPPEVRGWQPSNCYVLLDEGQCLVVDPGPLSLGTRLVEQLQTLLPPATPISIFLSRAELDTTGGIGSIARAFPVERLYAGGGPNPFDSFEAAGDVQLGDRRERIQLERMPAGFQIPVGSSRSLQVIAPSIRLLATWWSYDAASKSLFTSDSFTHAITDDEWGPRLLSSEMDEQVTDAQVKAHLTSKFEWLRHAKTPTLHASLRAVFDEYDVERIAPAHGRVLEGAAVVRKHVGVMLDVLEELAS